MGSPNVSLSPQAMMSPPAWPNDALDQVLELVDVDLGHQQNTVGP
jgi:hypothetical protein